jgi:uncharacterized membrane protein YeaQ/YmgE (transglycosylase-associated protein family)
MEVTILVWPIVGAITGWLTRILIYRHRSVNQFISIIVGAIGGVIGGFVFETLGIGGNVTGLNIYSIMAAIVGASILQGIQVLVKTNERSIATPKSKTDMPKHDSPSQVPLKNSSVQQRPSVFISYRRLPSAMLATLMAKELERQDIRVYVDTRQQDGAGPFPDRLLSAIREQRFFVCLVADSTFDSDWVLKEIEYAHKLNKIMIPVFQESYNPTPNPPNEHIQALLQYDGVKILDRSNLYVDEAIAHVAKMIKVKSS